MKKWLFPLCAALLLGVTACAPGAVSKESPPPVSRPADTASPAPVPTEVVSVYTDWSKLGEKPGPLPEIKSRRYEEYTDTLIPKDDYGMLISYAGSRLLDDWPATTGCLYGLMTADGTIVTDPVFSNAYRPGNLPLLVLSRGDPTLGEEAWDPAKIAIAAADGSWVTEFEYRCLRPSNNGLLLCAADSLTLMAPDGTIAQRYTPADLGLTQKEFEGLLSNVIWYEGCGGNWVGDYVSLKWADDAITAICLFQVSTGEQVTMLYDEWGNYCAQVMEPPPDNGWEVKSGAGTTMLYHGEETYVFQCETSGSAEVHGDLVLFGSGAVYTLEGKELLPPLENGMVQWVSDEIMDDESAALLMVVDYGGSNATQSYYTTDGKPIPRLQGMETGLANSWYLQVKLQGGLLEVLDLNMASYYDIDTMECVFRTYLGYDQGA